MKKEYVYCARPEDHCKHLWATLDGWTYYCCKCDEEHWVEYDD